MQMREREERKRQDAHLIKRLMQQKKRRKKKHKKIKINLQPAAHDAEKERSEILDLQQRVFYEPF